ncbi:MAG: metallophosphoesterase [Pseudolabrys sp.]|nr:metallophosphoesterase [Pseudolabrys sp.]
MTADAPSEFAPKPAPSGLTRRGLIKTGLGLTGIAGIASTGTITYAAMEAANGLSITDYRLTPPGWPAGQRLTIAVVADLHAGGPNMGLARVRQVVDAANALSCDLTVLLGDYFATHRFVTEVVPPPAWAAELARLSAPLGVYSILGNHDWWHDIKGTRAALAAVRIPVMENDAVLLGEPGRRFWLAGLGDQLAYFIGHRQFRGVDDLPGTLSKITTADPVILLAHEPDIFTQVPGRVALTLAGHTHGGQIRLPLIEPFWAPSEYGARFAYGHIVEQNRHMIVSGGLGTSKVPLRLGMPPEIVRVTLGV